FGPKVRVARAGRCGSGIDVRKSEERNRPLPAIAQIDKTVRLLLQRSLRVPVLRLGWQLIDAQRIVSLGGGQGEKNASRGLDCRVAANRAAGGLVPFADVSRGILLLAAKKDNRTCRGVSVELDFGV